MFKKLFESYGTVSHGPPKEGDLYRIVTVFGKAFPLYYGYYEECDRQNPLCEPVLLYPDFRKEPQYTEEGEPFVTEIQDACVHYRGAEKRTENSTCVDCGYFRKGEEWIGLCQCEQNRKNE